MQKHRFEPNTPNVSDLLPYTQRAITELTPLLSTLEQTWSSDLAYGYLYPKSLSTLSDWEFRPTLPTENALLHKAIYLPHTNASTVVKSLLWHISLINALTPLKESAARLLSPHDIAPLQESGALLEIHHLRVVLNTIFPENTLSPTTKDMLLQASTLHKQLNTAETFIWFSREVDPPQRVGGYHDNQCDPSLFPINAPLFNQGNQYLLTSFSHHLQTAQFFLKP